MTNQNQFPFKLTKLERTLVEAVKKAPFGLPDWNAIAKAENVPLEYIQQRLDWLRSMGVIE